MGSRVEKYNTGGDQKRLKPFEANEENTEDLIYEFLKNLGESIERAYRRDLKAFFDFTRVQFGLPQTSGPTVHFFEIRRVHIVKYKKFLEVAPSHRKKKFAPNTINRKLSVVSSFFQFLLQREVVEKNPAEFCKRPSQLVMEETQVFSDRKMKTLFDLIIEEAPPLHKSSILLLFTTGMRQAELRNLKLSNFKSIEGIRFVNYIGKGQKMNQVPVHPTSAYYLDEYFYWMKKIGREIKLDFGINSLGMKRMVATMETSHLASKKVVEKIDFTVKKEFLNKRNHNKSTYLLTYEH